MDKERFHSIEDRCIWRGKCNEHTWSYGFITDILYCENIACIDNKISVNADTLGQYSGRKDKNKVEIYEGDILLDENDDMCIVVYRDGEWVLDYMSRMNWYLRDTSSEECQVIGNIHDNPELSNK